MSTNAAAKQQRAQPPSRTQPPTEGNDGKRRRNRAILSCLSCHGSKRMCDRKRPTCARCTELGLYCVYEVDDPNQRLNTQDRGSRLLKRVAELEGEIEELKNKKRQSQRLSEFSGQCGDQTNIYISHPSSPASSLGDLSAFQALISPSMRASSIPPSNVGINDASAGTELTDSELSSILGQNPLSIGFSENNVEMHNRLNTISATNSSQHNDMQPCNCIEEASNYQTMLELSLRLRKAAGILKQYPLHQAGRYCLLHQTLVELDTITTETLSSVDSPHPRMPSYSKSPALHSSFSTTSPAFRASNFSFGSLDY
ncbi:hypothetical protein BT96DRAFT_1001255 [Gymnopus androsaceus JB14]|uniref:Zn(2)-C6 fungal-type domain-containing protein n=1 Tax=Gymnopus androsaceus JB14 TaxID=1447944 RepID=A0A6A4H2H4_9AGAR|nr:hypothetical protein BT96DRAFT_1001255 [Gymnopus androsaceus JB14]